MSILHTIQPPLLLLWTSPGFFFLSIKPLATNPFPCSLLAGPVNVTGPSFSSSDVTRGEAVTDWAHRKRIKWR